MPDWIIHMGAAHALGRPLRRWDLRWLFLGAVLPDLVARVVGSAVASLPFLEPLRVPPVPLYLGLLHTPFSVLLLLLAVAVFARDRREAVAGMLFGAALHFVLDLLQRSYGGGLSMLYPVDLRRFGFDAVWYENPATYVVVPVFAVYLIALATRREDPPRERAFRGWSRRRGQVALALLVVTFGLPLLYLDRAFEMNLGATRLAAHPDEYEGQEIELSVALVREVGDDQVAVEVHDRPFLIPRSSLPAIEVNDLVSVRGVYRDGRVEPSGVFIHDYGFKRLVSIAGMVLLLVFWLPLDWRRRWTS